MAIPHLTVEDAVRRVIYAKLAESQQEVASGAKLLPIDEVFTKYKEKYDNKDAK